jgi:DNA polymerase epsilon subunit 1
MFLCSLSDATNSFASLSCTAVRPSTIDTKNQHPALEFVKSLCHVFSLDPQAESVVRSLKRSAMRILGVREFSKEDTFRNPCQAFILPDVFCPSCCQTRDLDLCRDAKLTPEKWRCVCGEPYNKAPLEMSLVELVHRRFTAYQVQDLVHDGRRDVKDDHMGDVMDYRCKIPAERFIQLYDLPSHDS